MGIPEASVEKCEIFVAPIQYDRMLQFHLLVKATTKSFKECITFTYY